MYHQTGGIRPATCRKAGCSELASQRYEPGHAWNDFCDSHADDVAAKLAARGPNAFLNNKGPQKVIINN